MKFADELAQAVIELREKQNQYDELRTRAIEELEEKTRLIGEKYIIEKRTYSKTIVDQSKMSQEDIEKYQTEQNIDKLNVIETKTGSVI